MIPDYLLLISHPKLSSSPAIGPQSSNSKDQDPLGEAWGEWLNRGVDFGHVAEGSLVKVGTRPSLRLA